MTLRNGIWVPFDPDESELDGGTAIQHGLVLFADDGLFQFDAITESSPLTDDAGIFSGPVDALADAFELVTGADVDSTASNSVASLETSESQSQDELQATSAAAIDWRLTPDYDDDPGWYPGVIWQPLTEQLSAVQDIVSTNPVLQEVVERASSLVDELSSLYPGIVWPPLLGQGADRRPRALRRPPPKYLLSATATTRRRPPHR